MFSLYFLPERFKDEIHVQEEAIALIACLATDIELVWHQSAVEGIHDVILKAMSTFPDEKSLSEISLEALGMSIPCPLMTGLAWKKQHWHFAMTPGVEKFHRYLV